MAVRVDRDKCTACNRCIDICPVNAIMANDVVQVNEDECVECGTCIEECPNGALSLPNFEV